MQLYANFFDISFYWVLWQDLFLLQFLKKEEIWLVTKTK